MLNVRNNAWPDFSLRSKWDGGGLLGVSLSVDMTAVFLILMNRVTFFSIMPLNG